MHCSDSADSSPFSTAAAGYFGALSERGELGPNDFRIERVAACVDGKAAVDPRHHPFAAQQVGDVDVADVRHRGLL